MGPTVPPHTGVQSYAAERNANAELYVEFLLDSYAKRLLQRGAIQSYEIQSQKLYQSDIASDIWDHFLTFYEIGQKKQIELWCQTTCYKGNLSGKPSR